MTSGEFSLPAWFRQIWPRNGARWEVMKQYAAVGQFKHFLTDLALRGHVFSPAPAATDLFAAGIVEGRRRLALEIIKIAGTDPATLWDLVEKKEPKNAPAS